MNYTRIQPQLYDDYIIINFSILEWYGIKDRIYSIKNETGKVKQENSSELKVVKLMGKDFNIQLVNDSVLNTILGALNRTLGTIYVKITPDDYILTVIDSSVDIILRINVENFYIFECQDKIEFEINKFFHPKLRLKLLYHLKKYHMYRHTY